MNNQGKCVSCTDPGKYFYNGAICTLCSEDKKRFLNSKQECILAKVCSDSEYTKTAATATSDAVCGTVKECARDEYESKAPGVGADRQCEKVTACFSYETEESKPTATKDRVCSSKARSCSQIWRDEPSLRTKNGYYNLVKYHTMPATAESEERGRYAKFADINCRDSGKYYWSYGQTAAKVTYPAPRILEEVVWYSVYRHSRRGCNWLVQGSENNGYWHDLGEFSYGTKSEGFKANGQHDNGAAYNFDPGGSQGTHSTVLTRSHTSAFRQVWMMRHLRLLFWFPVARFWAPISKVTGESCVMGNDGDMPRVPYPTRINKYGEGSLSKKRKTKKCVLTIPIGFHFKRLQVRHQRAATVTLAPTLPKSTQRRRASNTGELFDEQLQQAIVRARLKFASHPASQRSRENRTRPTAT